MFRKKLNTLPYLEDNFFEYKDDFESVMQFIKNNKTIRKKLEEYKESEKEQNNITKLEDAIKKGDLNNLIFQQYDCESYALYLLKENKISIVDFATIFIYLEALMHTGVQAVKAEDKQYIKETFEVTISILDDDIKNLIKNKLNELWFEQHEYTKFDENDFDECTKNLSDLDKNIIVIKKPDVHKKYINVEDHIIFLKESVLRTPCILDDENYYYIPTVGMIILIMQAVNKNRFIKIAPIFGNINISTLNLMHQRGYHPLPLYSKYVKSNVIEVHSVKPGPLLTLLHDLVHIFWGTEINQLHYRFVFEYLIPKTADMLNITIDDILQKESNWSLYHLIDLNFNNNSQLLSKIYLNNPNIYLYNSFLHAFSHTEKKEPEYLKLISEEFDSSDEWDSENENDALAIFKKIFDDKKIIIENYGIDLDEVYKNLYLVMAHYISIGRLNIDLFKAFFRSRFLIEEKYNINEILKEILLMTYFSNNKISLFEILPECSNLILIVNQIIENNDSNGYKTECLNEIYCKSLRGININDLCKELSGLTLEYYIIFKDKLDEALLCFKFPHQDQFYKNKLTSDQEALKEELEILQDKIQKYRESLMDTKILYIN